MPKGYQISQYELPVVGKGHVHARQIRIGELAREAGIPDGVFNVVTGPSSIQGKELTSNPSVRKLSFTGSTVTLIS